MRGTHAVGVRIGVLHVLLTCFALLGVAFSAARAHAAAAESPPRRVPAPGFAPVVLVSMDGFRNDYLERYAPPALARLARAGATAKAMRPAFPTKTFPNHYTLVTGWYPADHGILDNTIKGPGGETPLTMQSAESIDWWRWRGEPIWVTAEKQGLITATMFWPASAATIHGYRPTYFHPYSRGFSYEDRVAQILKWLDLPPAERPAFLSLYFDATDVSGHATGPWSEATRDAVGKIDAAIALLVRGLEQRGLYDAVNLIVTADHGMSEIPPGDRSVYISDHVKLGQAQAEGAAYHAIVRIRGEDAAALLDQLRNVPHARAFLLSDAPAHLHFGSAVSEPAILLLADDGWVLKTVRNPSAKAADPMAGRTRGTHGYDNAYESMKVPFLAHGPAFAAGARMEEFDNVNVYSLLAHLLGVVPAANSGTLTPFAPILRETRTARR